MVQLGRATHDGARNWVRRGRKAPWPPGFPSSDAGRTGGPLFLGDFSDPPFRTDPFLVGLRTRAFAAAHPTAASSPSSSWTASTGWLLWTETLPGGGIRRTANRSLRGAS